MPEPHAAVGGSVALGVITLSGTFLGIHYDGLFGGLGGGLVALMWLSPTGTLNAFLRALASAFLGGVFGPFAAAAAGHFFPWAVNGSAEDLTRVASAVFVGLFVHAAGPLAIEVGTAIARRKASKGEPS